VHFPAVSWVALSTEITVYGDAENEYWVTVQVNGFQLKAQIDTGMTQPSCVVGLGLRADDFERLALMLPPAGSVQQLTGTPLPVSVPMLSGRVSIEGLDNTEIETNIARLSDNLLGVCYFHHLPEFELYWDFAARAMTIRRKS